MQAAQPDSVESGTHVLQIRVGPKRREAESSKTGPLLEKPAYKGISKTVKTKSTQKRRAPASPFTAAPA